MPATSTSKQNVSQVIPFFRVSDMDRSIRFYVDGVGFTIAARWDVEGELRWCRLELGGAALMLQTAPRASDGSSALSKSAGEGVSICFQCEDTPAIYHSVQSRGISAREPEVGNNMWYTTIIDPDGYRLEFHSPTDVPEDTKLSDLGESA